MDTFRTQLLSRVKHHLQSVKCRFVDNHFYYYNMLIELAKEIDIKWFRENRIPAFESFEAENHARIEREVENKSALFELLADEHSRNILLYVATYSLLGRRFVKFPYYAADNIEQRNKLYKMTARRDIGTGDVQVLIDALEYGFPLDLFDLRPVGKDVIFYASVDEVYRAVFKPAYKYRRGAADIAVKAGDYVMDCGACLGDTAMMFALEAGGDGRVFSFEPNPLYVEMFNINSSLNKKLEPRVTLMELGMSDKDDQKLDFAIQGPGSCLMAGRVADSFVTKEVQTASIDRVVRDRRLPRLDFIKMDIEGAELAALRGAMESIMRFRPQLAVCLYHKPDDYLHIPEFINELGLGYKFYVDHHYVNEWETVLYATV